MATLTSKNILNPVVAPRLPAAPVEYAQRYGDDLTNILRLYFNQLDNLNATVYGSQGGRFLNFPYAAIQRTTDKSFTANTATQITFDTNDFLNGCTNDGTDGIHVEYAGIYNYQFSVQLLNTDTSIRSAWIWLRKNGTDLAGTASKFDVTSSHGGVAGANIAAANFYVQLAAKDYVEMWAAVDNIAVTFDATAAQVSPFVMPSIPSVVATLSFVSSLPT
jgi:hypothetical protein